MSAVIEEEEARLVVYPLDDEGARLIRECESVKEKLVHKPPIRVFGKNARMQRDVGFFSDVCEGYKYSGQMSKAMPMTAELRRLLNYVNAKFGSNFNGILVNRYENGDDFISKHSDDESGLDPKAGVVALTFGSERKFRIRDKETGKMVIDVLTRQDEMIQMAGAQFQKKYTHEIPKQKGVGERMSFTFRYHV
jgi:alkylated DNA repair dioxygenase AlkB